MVGLPVAGGGARVLVVPVGVGVKVVVAVLLPVAGKRHGPEGPGVVVLR